MQPASYTRFFAMIAVSAAIMHVLMYLNTWDLSHVAFSQTRLWMTLIMAAGMMPVMLVMMRSMYPDKRRNAAICVGSALLMAVSLWGVRSQHFVDDTSWMRAMIPHHSIAILTSSRARIEDSRVRALADRIIETQLREIDEMKALIAELD